MGLRVLVTPRSLTSRPADEVTELRPLLDSGWDVVQAPAGRTPSVDELLELVRDIDAWLAGVETIPGVVLRAAAPRLQIIARNGVGADAVDLDAAKQLGISIALARGANSRGVAELALALLLTCLRDIPASNEMLHAGGWDRRIGRELPDVTVGVVGFGAIGRMLSSLVVATGGRVVAFDPYSEIDIDGVQATGDLHDLFSRSDAVSLHLPLIGSGPLVTSELLAELPGQAILLNTARAGLVDPDAVLSALETGALAWYAVDAFESEPPDLTPLLAHSRTVLTPHLGGFTGSSVRRAAEQAVSAILATVRG